MTVDLDRQLREYCLDMDERQGALSFDDILERTGELQVIPRRGTKPPTPRRWWVVIGAAAFVVLFVVIGIGFLPAMDGTSEPANAPPPPTVTPNVESSTDLDVIEEGVAALYAGDADRAAELFELSDRTDEEIREEAAYQRAIGGRLTLSCNEEATPGVFICTMPYHNAATDAIGYVDSPPDTNRIVVEEGVITEFAEFPEHTWFLVEMGTYLATEGRFEGYEDCVFGPFPESCATIQLENLDGWAQWRESFEAADEVEVALESWYRGDCEAALFLTGPDNYDDYFVDCSTTSSAAQTIAYESILGAQVSVENCVETSAGVENPDPGPSRAVSANLSCEVRYSNAMNSAVGKPPSMIAREFTVTSLKWGVLEPDSDEPWHQGDYPEDTQLRESFRRFAEDGELAEEYAAAGCTGARTAECANLIVDNLDDWAAWHDANN